jgi:hypothetical protein
MEQIQYPHLSLTIKPDSIEYTPNKTIVTIKYPERDKSVHGRWLQKQFVEIWQQNTNLFLSEMVFI